VSQYVCVHVYAHIGKFFVTRHLFVCVCICVCVYLYIYTWLLSPFFKHAHVLCSSMYSWYTYTYAHRHTCTYIHVHTADIHIHTYAVLGHEPAPSLVAGPAPVGALEACLVDILLYIHTYEYICIHVQFWAMSKHLV
jgi:hypothetical protein